MSDDTQPNEKVAKDALKEMLELRFRHVDRDHPAMAALFLEALRHWRQQEKTDER